MYKFACTRIFSPGSRTSHSTFLNRAICLRALCLLWPRMCSYGPNTFTLSVGLVRVPFVTMVDMGRALRYERLCHRSSATYCTHILIRFAEHLSLSPPCNLSYL